MPRSKQTRCMQISSSGRPAACHHTAGCLGTARRTRVVLHMVVRRLRRVPGAHAQRVVAAGGRPLLRRRRVAPLHEDVQAARGGARRRSGRRLPPLIQHEHHVLIVHHIHIHAGVARQLVLQRQHLEDPAHTTWNVDWLPTKSNHGELKYVRRQPRPSRGDDAEVQAQHSGASAGNLSGSSSKLRA